MKQRGFGKRASYTPPCGRQVGGPGPDPPYLCVCRGFVSETGKINVIRDLTAANGKIVVLVAFRELYDEYLLDTGRLRETAAIARSNIQAELKAEEAWIKFDEPPRQHRCRLPWKNGGNDTQRTYWALDYEKCQQELKDVFRSIYARELEELDHGLTDDDQGVHVKDLAIRGIQTLSPQPPEFIALGQGAPVSPKCRVPQRS